jgi:type II secretory pathway pseudopilin PulG
VVKQSKPSKANSFLTCSVALLILTIVSLVVIPVLLIVAAIALPALGRARANARQAAVQEALRTIAAYQVDFQATGDVDENGDGIGDYATLPELRRFAEDATLGASQNGYDFQIEVTYGNDEQKPSFAGWAISRPPYIPDAYGFRVDQTGVVTKEALPPIAELSFEANETAAIDAMRTIVSGQTAFKASGLRDINGDGVGEYGPLVQLAHPPKDPPFIDDVLGTGEKHGYRFTVTLDDLADKGFMCVAVPQEPGKTGERRFYVDQTGVVRFTADGSQPTLQSPPLD